MNDVTYSFSFHCHTPPTLKKEADLFAFDDCLDFPLTEQQSLVRSRRTGQQGILTSDALFALRQCTKFRSWEEQIRAIQGIMPPGGDHRTDIDKVLQGARQMGLLLSARGFLETIPSRPCSPSITSTCYCLLTCDRPQALARLLDSMRQYHTFLPEQNRYLIIDDSRNPVHQQRNLDIVRQAREADGLPFQYFGEEEQGRLLQALRRRLSSEQIDSLAFLLERHRDPHLPSHGKNRNWALLLGGGEKLVMLDDDILFEKRVPETADASVTLGHHRREADFFTQPEGWRSYDLADDPDPTRGLGLSLVGTTLSQALDQLATGNMEPSALRDTDTRELRHLAAESRIVMATCGYLGDPGTASSQWLFELEGEARQRLLSKEEDYRLHMTERNNWVGSRNFQLSSSFTIMSGVTIIDNTITLPPYFPLFRGEDLLFGGMLQRMHPRGLLADLPWAVPHLPMEPRQWDHSRTLDQPATSGFLKFCQAVLLDNCSDLEISAASRLKEFSEIFQALSEMNAEAFSLKLGEKNALERSARIYKIGRILAESGSSAPRYWRRDLSRILEVNQKSLMKNQPGGFVEFPTTGEDNELLEPRKLLSRYARALRHWPAILAAAQPREGG